MKKVLYHLFVNGVPKAQPRPRMTANGHVYNPDTADSWKNEIMAAFLPCRKQVITEPVHIRVSFFFLAPKKKKVIEERTNIPHVKKPDIDNLLKSTMDSLTDIGIWKDDAFVFAISADKWYTDKKPGAQIIIETGF